MWIEIEILGNGFVVKSDEQSAVFISKREAIEYISECLPDIDAENAREALRLRRKEFDGKSLYDQYTTEAQRLPERMQDTLRCFDNIITMSACTGISERAIRNYLHYGERKPSSKTLTRVTRWLRNPTFVGEVADE